MKQLTIRNPHKTLTRSTFHYEFLITNFECEALVILQENLFKNQRRTDYLRALFPKTINGTI